MTQEPFAPPGDTNDSVPWAENVGALMMIKPFSLETGIPTVNGITDAVRASVLILDGPHAGTEHENVLIFPRMLQAQLKARIGKTVLARLGQGAPKPGKNPPWVLTAANPGDEQIARAALNRRSTSNMLPPNAAPPF